MFNKVAFFLKSLFNTKNPYFYESYSLEGEDRLIDRYFDGKSSGFYIDIGANHPLRFNNTYIFYKKGWRGVNIDADRNCIKLFNNLRRGDVNILSAVGNTEQYKNYFVFNDSALNTFDKKYSDHYQEIGYKLIKTLKIKFKKISSILSKLSIPKKIDLMSIDVEGMELEVLKSNDWKRYRPELILVEVFVRSGLEHFSNNKLNEYLKSKGYSLYAKTLTNFIFKDEKK